MLSMVFYLIYLRVFCHRNVEKIIPLLILEGHQKVLYKKKKALDVSGAFIQMKFAVKFLYDPLPFHFATKKA